MKELFKISVTVDKPIVVGQDKKNGRRQLIPITGGKVEGVDLEGNPMNGICLPGGIDSQIIRSDGKCDLSARYAIRLDDGRSFYIENNGIRTVPEEYVEAVVNGQFVDPSVYYFATVPTIEVYDESLRWLENHIFYCKAIRQPDCVIITYYMVEK